MMMIPKKRNEFDLFDDLFDNSFLERRDAKIMRTDIREKGNNYIIDVDLPGYDKENIDIEMEHGYLRVTARMDKKKDIFIKKDTLVNVQEVFM